MSDAIKFIIKMTIKAIFWTTFATALFVFWSIGQGIRADDPMPTDKRHSVVKNIPNEPTGCTC